MITEGQHAWLTKRGVKLVSPRKLANDFITDLQAKEDFVGASSQIAEISKVVHIKNMHQMVRVHELEDRTKDWADSDSFYKKMFCKYHQMKSDKASYIDVFAKLSLYNALGNRTTSNRSGILEEIERMYPMLEFTSYFSMTSNTRLFEHIVGYIDQVDCLVKTAVEETVAIVEADEEIAVVEEDEEIAVVEEDEETIY
jgi:hypothetical protein